MAEVVKNLPAMQETQVWSLGWEDPQEEGMATHSSILAWRVPWTEEPGGLQSIQWQRVGHDWSDWACTHIFSIFTSYMWAWKDVSVSFRVQCYVCPWLTLFCIAQIFFNCYWFLFLWSIKYWENYLKSFSLMMNSCIFPYTSVNIGLIFLRWFY